MIVVDTNVMVYLLAGEGSRADRAADLLLRDQDWAAPPILLSELRNVLAGSVRRGLVKLPDALSMQSDAALILGDRTPGVDGAAVLRAAVDLGLSACDAEFVVLARMLGVPLVTEDREVLQAAGDVAVGLSDD